METNPEILRQEIIASENARMDFLKYKLLSIAVLGAVGLGLQGQNGILNKDIDYVLCLIPLVCVYVDFLSYHNNIRILVISRYLWNQNDKYENFISDLYAAIDSNTEFKGRDLFNMEDFVLIWSSIFISALLIIYGIILSCFTEQNLICFNFETPKVFIFTIFGIIGIVLTILAKKKYDKRTKLISDTEIN